MDSNVSLYRPSRQPEYPTRAQAAASLEPLLRAGLSVREVAERLCAHPRAVAALMHEDDPSRRG
jgi:hypothetical protein